MKNKLLFSNAMLLLAAAIWGFAFVAQRVGNRYLGSFTFNGVRFALGGLSLIPILLVNRRRTRSLSEQKIAGPRYTIFSGIFCGAILFAAASLQQLGMVDTTAGKAAFITGMYIIIVPFFGVFLKRKLGIMKWAAALIALTGLYLLCIQGDFVIKKGDFLLLLGSFFWAFHILAIDYFSGKVDALKLSFIQTAACSVLSIAVALIFEKISVEGLWLAGVAILYGGVCSVGIAYTLQVVGQKYADPTLAAIILSMESVFAVMGGFLLLSEKLSLRGLTGCLLMLAGMLVSQLPLRRQT